MNEKNEIKLPTGETLTQNECFSLAEFIDFNLIPAIRDDGDIDNMLWLCNIISAFKKIAEAGKYNYGCGESAVKDREENEDE